MTPLSQAAPELDVVQWFNTPGPLTLAGLRGRIVVVHAFQMLCPGCVQAGLPQAQRIFQLFPADQVAVIGLHTVFEHHAAMTPVSLGAFIHEYRLGFPIGVDRPGERGPIPRTMAAYGMNGTPTLLLIDRFGRLRRHAFGVEEDLRVGADIARLIAEKPGSETDFSAS
ncbi:MAG: redoxin domain-containing protein [Acetobacteraceae bacterium]|nr:redoxin domain-containing protein [Acetobacteraceae bacterium]